MKSKGLILYILTGLIFFSLPLTAQTLPELVPYRKGKLWGYSDVNGNIKITPQYDYVAFFEGEVARVRQDKLWGLIDRKGQPLTKLDYESVGNFINGLATIIYYGKMGFINKRGEMVIEPKYYGANHLPNVPYIQVFNSVGEITIFDSLGTQIYISDQGIHHTPLKNGLWLISENRKYGFTNKDGSIYIEPQFDNFREWDNGLVLITKELKYKMAIKIIELDPHTYYPRNRDMEYEYDHKNQVVYILITQLEAEELKEYGQDITDRTMEVKKMGLINRNGKWLTTVTNDHIEQLTPTLAVIGNGPSAYGLIDTAGKMILDMAYDRIGMFSDGLASVAKDEKVGFVDTKGNIVIPIIYDQSGYAANGFIAVAKNHEWGFVSYSGKEITDLIYREVSAFNNGLAAVSKDYNRWGFIDTTGKMIIEPQYRMIMSEFLSKLDIGQDMKWKGFNNNRAIVTKQVSDSSRQLNQDFILRDGTALTNFKYVQVWPFVESRARVMWYLPDNRTAVYNFIDEKGALISSTNFSAIEDFKDGIATVRSLDRREGWLIDKNGKVLTESALPRQLQITNRLQAEYGNYSEINGVFRVNTGSGQYGYISKEGVKFFEE